MKNILESANSGFGNGNSLWLLTLLVMACSSWCALWRRRSVDTLHVDCQERLKESVWNECMLGRFFPLYFSVSFHPHILANQILIMFCWQSP
jgi:uncharacterized iron-regulated membrane protein